MLNVNGRILLAIGRNHSILGRNIHYQQDDVLVIRGNSMFQVHLNVFLDYLGCWESFLYLLGTQESALLEHGITS